MCAMRKSLSDCLQYGSPHDYRPASGEQNSHFKNIFNDFHFFPLLFIVAIATRPPYAKLFISINLQAPLKRIPKAKTNRQKPTCLSL
jgi:hypothetical protein